MDKVDPLFLECERESVMKKVNKLFLFIIVLLRFKIIINYSYFKFIIIMLFYKSISLFCV